MLKSRPEVCGASLDCRGISEREARQFVDAALLDKQTMETSSSAWRQLFVSGVTVVISFLALIVSFLAFRSKRREGLAEGAEVGKPAGQSKSEESAALSMATRSRETQLPLA